MPDTPHDAARDPKVDPERDPSANPGAFSSGVLVARRQSDLVVPSADERGKHALDL